jgi:hypothetical protein
LHAELCRTAVTFLLAPADVVDRIQLVAVELGRDGLAVEIAHQLDVAVVRRAQERVAAELAFLEHRGVAVEGVGIEAPIERVAADPQCIREVA